VSHPGTFESAPVGGIPKCSDQDTSTCPPGKYHPALLPQSELLLTLYLNNCYTQLSVSEWVWGFNVILDT